LRLQNVRGSGSPSGYDGRAKSLDDLATQLRERFPDEAYERRLRRERDREAEERRADAMNKLIDILVEAVVKEAAEVDDAGRTAKL
jgi:hypothetical protein